MPCFRHADKLYSVRTHKGQCIHFYVHVYSGNPTRTPVCALLGWVGSSYTNWYISKRASHDTVRGGNHRGTWRRIRVLCVCT